MEHGFTLRGRFLQWGISNASKDLAEGKPDRLGMAQSPPYRKMLSVDRLPSNGRLRFFYSGIIENPKTRHAALSRYIGFEPTSSRFRDASTN